MKGRSQVMWDQKYEEAIETLTDTIPSIPAEFRYLSHFMLAKAHFRLAKKQVEQGRTVEETHRNFQNNEHADSALQSLKEAARLNSQFAPTYALLADYHYRAGELAEELLAADSLVKLMPQCAEAYSKRGLCFSRLHRPKSALDDFRAALKFNPKDAEVYGDLGEVWYQLGEYEKSIDSYRTALSMNHPLPGSCHYFIGDSCREAGKYQQAILAYEKAKSLGQDAKACDQCISLCRERMR